VPEFTELEKLIAKKSRFKFCELFSVGALQQIAGWAQLILNTLTPAIDQLPKRTDDSYECKSWATAYVKFHLNSTCVLMIVSLYAE